MMPPFDDNRTQIGGYDPNKTQVGGGPFGQGFDPSRTQMAGPAEKAIRLQCSLAHTYYFDASVVPTIVRATSFSLCCSFSIVPSIFLTSGDCAVYSYRRATLSLLSSLIF